jgi:hypothetical protein
MGMAGVPVSDGLMGDWLTGVRGRADGFHGVQQDGKSRGHARFSAFQGPA